MGLIDEGARILKLYRQEVSCRHVYAAPLQAAGISSALQHLITPEVETAFVGIAIQKVEIMLPHKSAQNKLGTRPKR